VCIDMRKGIYSLYQYVKSEMRRNPLSGEVYLFYVVNTIMLAFYHKRLIYELLRQQITT